MATTVGRVELDVDADGSGLVRQMKVIGKRAGVVAGSEMGRSLTDAFSRETTHFDSQGGITRIRESFRTIDKSWDKLSARFGKNTRGMGRHMNVFRGHVMRTIGAWTLLVAIIGQGTAVLGSGLGAALTSLISSLGVGLVGAAAGAGAALTGLIWTISLATSAVGQMAQQFPAAQRGMNALAEAAKADAGAFARAWGPALAGFTERLAQLWRDDQIGERLGESLGKVTDAFTAVLESPAYSAFETAMETTIPNSLANLGGGLASVTEGFLQIFATVGPHLEAFTALFAQWAEGWAESIGAAAADGSLDRFFTTAFESLTALFDLVGSLGSALGTLFEAGAPAGNALLGHLTDLLDRWNEWMQSIEGQTTLQQWFANGQVIFMAVLDLLGQLGTVLADIVTPEAIEGLLTFFDALGNALPILGEIISLVGDLQVLTILAEILNLVGALLTPIMPILREFATIIGGMLVEGLQTLGPKFEELGVALGPILSLLAELAIAILPSVIAVIIAVVDYLTLFVEALTGGEEGTEEFKTAVEIMGNIVRVIFETLANVIQIALTTIGGAMKVVGALLRGDFSGAFKHLEKIGREVFRILGLDIDEFGNWISDMATEAGNFLRDIGGFFEDMATNIGNAIQDAIGWIQDAINWFGSLFGAANDASGAMSGARGGYSTVGQGGGAVAMASGGVLWGRTKALMGESGPEAVVPLRRNLSQVDPSVRWLSALAQGKYPALASGGVSTGAAGRTVLVQPGAIVVDGSGNPERVAVGVVNRIAERLG